MSTMLTGSVKERRHSSTINIDRLSTLDMLQVIHQEDANISSAITPFLNTIARVVDNAAATLSHGGRLVIVGAGPSGRVAEQAAKEYAPGKHPVIALTAGDGAGNYERGVAELQAIKFGEHDMMLAPDRPAVKRRGCGEQCDTPGRWGRRWRSSPAMRKVKRHSWRAWVIAPELGADVVAGF